MATRSIVAYPTKNGFEGYYVHWDGYPSGVGCGVYQAFNALGEDGLKSFLSHHRSGFRSFPEKFVSDDHSDCYCNNTYEEALLNHEEAVSVGCEYAYVLKGNLLHIYSAYSNGDKRWSVCSDRATLRLIGTWLLLLT